MTVRQITPQAVGFLAGAIGDGVDGLATDCSQPRFVRGLEPSRRAWAATVWTVATGAEIPRKPRSIHPRRRFADRKLGKGM